VYRDFFRSIISKHDNGTYELEQGMMSRLIATQGGLAGRMFPRRILNGLGRPRGKDEPVTQRHMDIAAGLQEALEETVLHMLTALQKQTGERNLCMAGGVALNSTMNGKIARSGLFDAVSIHPAAHDAGTCVGAALYGYHNILNEERQYPKHKHRYWGPGFSGDDVRAACQAFDEKVLHGHPDNLYDLVAAALAEGKVVGWYQDRMEWGPRALGNRSILADPRRDDMKDIVNHAVKLREGFRPFAPAALAEHAHEWFDMTGLAESPYMLFVVPVQEDKRSQIPAVTHVDGSARVQTVTATENPKFHKLISAFYKITGVPVLLNTSFNVKGEPIVNSPEDAIRCFLGTQIDMLVLHDTLVEKRPEVAAATTKKGGGDSGRVVNGQINAA
jgi:carbamoyltransferase